MFDEIRQCPSDRRNLSGVANVVQEEVCLPFYQSFGNKENVGETGYPYKTYRVGYL